MPPKRILFSIAILLLSSLSCKAVTQLVFPEEVSPTLPPKLVTVLPPTDTPPQVEPVEPQVTCPDKFDQILEAASSDGYLSESDAYEPEEQYLVTYSVTGDRIDDPYYERVSADLAGYQNDLITHQEIWEYFITLIPLQDRTVLSEFSIITDGKDNLLAAVAQTYSDPEQWALEVDIADSDDRLNLTYTLIHEYAHLLTLGPSQVTPSLPVFNNPDDDEIYYSERTACPDYFPGEGCALPASYINAFYKEFWTDIYLEWQDINLIEDDDEYYTALDDFYYDYEDRFLTDYAATNPEEDIAESFTFFVLSTRPMGYTIAEDKILFFYDYPELVQLRDQIMTGICILNP